MNEDRAMNTELEHLRKMRELLAKGWTQGAWARDENGNPVSELSPAARSFCILGARYRVCQDTSGKIKLDAIFIAAVEFNLSSIKSWNDDPKRTQPEVLAFIDRAIEIEETE